VWYPYVNSPYTLTTQGVGLGLGYSLPMNFVLNGNYNFATFSGTQSVDFQIQFQHTQTQIQSGVGE